MKLLRASDHKRMPWKNGGGETVEIAVSPDGVGLADFDWRVSMATVATDGPFSVFPGIDRTLSILDGEGMTLFIEGRAPERLTQASEPLPFAADAPTSATLIDGTITDLNVMTRRGSFTHSVRRVSVDGTVQLAPRGGVSLILCHRGHAKTARLSLSAGDCLLLEAVWTDIAVSGKAELFQIDIHPNGRR
ncbi:HutD family protein [Rhizobium sp. P40RR-XXII]|uniref:HutD/Ves family protein n=1 Tax=unclassified Rhizobium TaxID=2613769 RepID=UPI001456C3F1|nr:MULTISPECIES: HutD family protein [unclassified Rhizobium]NLR85198.1 HutD family protein [Rhizobium sp. P28RR-XV]NLS16827.1 HutD family protein [Rhizobium sp. P40RR-XXII]